jgi:ADP-dependent phosphofructokinase/glucokinase
MHQSIALGLGNNTDYELTWDPTVLERLIVRYAVGSQEIVEVERVAVERDLLRSLLYFLHTGVGSEVYVEDPAVIEEFARHFDKKTTIGGTSPRAAIAMARLGYGSFLHLVTDNPFIRKALPSSCAWTCSNQTESLYPHLIIQYPMDAVIHANDINIRTTCANRIIYDHDPDNIAMRLDPAFFHQLSHAKVLLLSGLNTMRDTHLLDARLTTLLDELAKLPSSLMVFFEEGCFFDNTMRDRIRTTLASSIDIHSMNEDEFQESVGRRIDLLDAEEVLAALKELAAATTAPVLVVHARHWALAYGAQADLFTNALRGGIAMATTRLRFGDEFTKADYVATYDLPAEKEGMAFSFAIEAITPHGIRCLPSLRLEAPPKATVGLGDAFVGGFLPQLIQITSYTSSRRMR